MQRSEAYKCSNQSKQSEKVLINLKQPMTAKQLSFTTEMSLDGCSHVLKVLARHGLVSCQNPDARKSRIYWLTDKGIVCQKKLLKALNMPLSDYDYSDVDLSLYGWICFSHRALVIRTLGEALQPAAIKRKVRMKNPTARISANNVRDVIKMFLRKGIVRKVYVRKKVHPLYELTGIGWRLRRLMVKKSW